MSAGDVFHDTNVIVYLLSSDPSRAERAETLLRAPGKISVQVLNEFASVASRKIGMDWPKIRALLADLAEVLVVEPLTRETHERATILAERYRIDIYDATIVAAALIAGCRVLYSEDFQAGQVFEGRLRVVNPFVDRA